MSLHKCVEIFPICTYTIAYKYYSTGYVALHVYITMQMLLWLNNDNIFFLSREIKLY